jgi:lipoprotein-anchoring transpeptidase ErfK/SrfK
LSERKGPVGFLPVFLLGLLAPAGLLLAVLMGLFLLYRSSLIIPGVEVLDLDLGGKSTAEAATLLQQKWQGQMITLVAPGSTTYLARPQTLGISLDVAATAGLAHRQSRSWQSLLQMARTGRPVEVAPLWRLSPSVAEAALQALAAQLQVPAVNAGLRVATGRLEPTPAQPGLALNVPATMTRLVQNTSQVFAEGRLTLVMRPVEPAITDVSPVLAEANELLANPLAWQVYDPIKNEVIEWKPELAEWGDWLLLQVEPGSPLRLEWQVNTDRVRAFITAKAASLGPGRYLKPEEVDAALASARSKQQRIVRLRLYHQEQQHVVQPGETLSSIAYDYGLPYPWIQEINPGVGDALSPGQNLILPSPDVLLPLPVVDNKRIVVSISQQKMWAYEQGVVKWEWPVSTGISSSPTAPGVFQVQTHELNAYAANWNLWMPHFMGIYRPVPSSDFMNGFHGFPTRYGSNLLWTNSLGHPVTYGCILVSSDNATSLYEWAEAGVVVEIQK